MKISTGEKIKRFAALCDIDEEEILDWVNCYVNYPQGNFPAFEKTEEERFKSIAAYINWRIENSTWARIKNTPALRKAA